MANDTSLRAALAGAAAGTRDYARVQRDPCDDPCPPACPACGALECLCRPRFFPGQLLTDDQLNLLMRYLTGKHKLHNRYLHGWGVACGLEVVCDPCDPRKVRVQTGYALSPCGDDILLCNEQAVDVCNLIDECTPPRRTMCDPPHERPPADCRKGEDRWVLAVCYEERPSRGLTALLGAGHTRCEAPCACGGSLPGCSGCGGSGCAGGASCGCGGNAGAGACPAPKAADYNARPRRSLKAECEPTQVCEGFRFIAYPAPPRLERATLPDLGNNQVLGTTGTLLAWMFSYRERLGPLLERVLCCVARARELLAQWGGSTRVDAATAAGAYLSYAEAMYAFATEFSRHRCAFVGQVGRLYDNASAWRARFGGSTQLDQEQLTYARNQMLQLENALLELLGECFCSALLPPCPEPVPSNCVPLAVVTLSPGNCRVLDICNWEQRRILLTWRTVGYWLSWVPWHCVRNEIAKFCCGSERGGGFVLRLMSLVFGVGITGLLNCGERRNARAAPASTPAAAPRSAPVAQPAAAPAPGATPANAANLNDPAGRRDVGDVEAARRSDDLFMHLLTEFGSGRSDKLAAPAWYALSARLSDGSLLDELAALRRLTESGQGGPAHAGAAATAPAMAATTAADPALAELRAEVAALQEQLQAQQARIDTLAAKKPRR